MNSADPVPEEILGFHNREQEFRYRFRPGMQILLH
jgi:hypothetical protein